MGDGGSIRMGRGPPPGGRRGLLLPAKPTLQGALAGHHGRIGGLGQAHADVAGSPGRVLLAQRQGHGVERVPVGGAPGAGLVGGLDAFASVAEVSE
jgi:hypothetical protein